MQIFDITVPLSEALPVFPGDPPVTVEMVASIKRGDAANVSRISLCSHSGTHLDVPRHFSDQGSTTDDIPLTLMVGEALVVGIPGVRRIGRALLEPLPLHGVERLLLKTDNSGLWARDGFCEEYAALTEDGAEFLVRAGVRLVGIDYLSIEPFHGNGNVHRLLLDGGVLILEGVNLAAVSPGRYELICLPLKVREGDGARCGRSCAVAGAAALRSISIRTRRGGRSHRPVRLYPAPSTGKAGPWFPVAMCHRYGYNGGGRRVPGSEASRSNSGATVSP